MRKKKPLNITISEEARRLLTLHAERAGTSVSGLIERLIREEDRQVKEAIARLDKMTAPKVN